MKGHNTNCGGADTGRIFKSKHVFKIFRSSTISGDGWKNSTNFVHNFCGIIGSFLKLFRNFFTV